MTIQEKFDACNSLRAEAVAAIGAGDQELARKKAEELKVAVGEYNEMWKALQYSEFLSAENPVLAAISRLYIYKLTATTKVNNETGELKDVNIRSTAGVKGKPGISDTVDIADLEDHSKLKICPNGQWQYWVENFTTIMCSRICQSIGNVQKAEYYRSHVRMSPEARELGRTADGNANAVSELQKIVDGMLFIDSGKTAKDGSPLNSIKITTKDLEYIKSVMCKETSSLQVSLPNAATMRRLITKAIHRAVLGKEYGFVFEEAEDADLPTIPGATRAQTREIVSE